MNKSTIGTATKGVLLLLLSTLFLLACKKSRSELKMEIHNTTGVALVLVNNQNGQRTAIGTGEITQIDTGGEINKFSIEAPVGDLRTFEFERTGERQYTVIGYLEVLEYRISGNGTKTAKVSFTDDQGAKVDLPTVDLPYKISYKKYALNKWSLSADNLEGQGSVFIQVLVKGKARTELSAPQAVAASGTIDGTSPYK